MKNYVRLVFLYLFSVSCISTSDNNKPNETKKPNVILILTDDQGYKDVGFNGSTDIKTPNLDRLANSGVQFTNAYVTYPVCGPSRAGIITGRYQDRFGFCRNPLFTPKDSLSGLPLSEQTLAEALKTQNYKTMAIGKWHLGAHDSQRPLKRGFDYFFGFLSGGHKYFPEELTLNNISEVKSQFDAYNTKLLRNNERVDEKEYLTDAFSREAVHFIEKNKKSPFFLYLAYNAPHAPLQATEKYLSRFPDIQDKKRKTYAAMISAVDDGVGNILNQLEELDIAENTLVIFLSDNGGDESKGADNGMLSNGKGSLFEGGIRVPFAMQWKGKIPAGKVYHEPIISLDIFKTATTLAGVNTKNELDGKNLIPYLLDEKKEAPHDELYWRMYDKETFAMRNGDYKLIKDKTGELKLYNLNQDVSEENTLNDSLRIQQMNTDYDTWNKLNKKPVFYGLMQNKIYNEIHPKRYENVEKY